jgi:hypothetical protein
MQGLQVSGRLPPLEDLEPLHRFPGVPRVLSTGRTLPIAGLRLNSPLTCENNHSGLASLPEPTAPAVGSRGVGGEDAIARGGSEVAAK